jgi:class III poly(R)-hydroxyalkanoic acid synthase PhaE subunit
MVEMGRGYFSMAEELMRKSATSEVPMDAFKTWMDQLSEALSNPASRASTAPGMKDFMAFWQLPLDTWQRFASSMMPLPGDLMKAFRPEGAAAFGQDMHEHMDRFLSMPGLGYSRESQAQYQDFGRRLLDYQRAYQAYEAALSRVAVDSVDRFRARLEEASHREQPISSLRELFNEWVDVCEEVYGEYAVSEEHARHYADLVNALMAVKQEGSRLVDEALETMNMPTRREVSTLQQRLQETRREMQRLRGQVEKMLETRADAPPSAQQAGKPKTAPGTAPKAKATRTRQGKSTKNDTRRT